MPLSPAVFKQVQDLRLANDFVRLRALCQRLLVKDPEDVVLNAYMGQALREEGAFVRALYFAQKAAAGAPNNADLAYELAFTLWKCGRLEEGCRAAERALELDPSGLYIHTAKIKMLEELNRFDEMVDAASVAVERYPSDIPLRCGRSLGLAMAGRADEASLLACQSLLDFPSSVEIAELACFCHNYVSGFTRERVFEVHRNYGRLVQQTAHDPPAKVHTDADPDRRINIAVMSSDLRQHSVGFFIEPFLRHYDKSRFHVTAWSCGAPQDHVSERIKGMVDAWRPEIPKTHVEFSALIRRSKPDILLELNGITQGHMLHTAFLRVAPVQCTYIGYPNTTGLDNVDYRIVDSLTDPPGEPYFSDRYATEKLARLDPCFLCYEPRVEGVPALGVRSADPSAPITFASFNATFKINDQIINLWRRVVQGVPGSRLIIKSAAIKTAGMVGSIRRAFARNGFDLSRLDVRMGTEKVVDHLAFYNQVDIALDTFPYHGTTTTCEAMLMGVPVVVLAGRAHASRVGVSLLTNVGLPELVGGSEQEYVQIACGLAGDRARLRGLQGSLRSRLLGSTLCDAQGYSRNLQSLLVGLWQGYCRGRAKA